MSAIHFLVLWTFAIADDEHKNADELCHWSRLFCNLLSSGLADNEFQSTTQESFVIVDCCKYFTSAATEIFGFQFCATSSNQRENMAMVCGDYSLQFVVVEE